jgi:3-oxoacyl-[acyl-carrier-protein] synthase II
MRRERRVVITGVGAVAPNGIGRDAFWEALVAGRSGVDYLTRFDCTDFPVKIAGQVDEFDTSRYIRNCSERRMQRFARFAVSAARMAVEDAAFRLDAVAPHRMGACFGSTIAGITAEDQQVSFQRRGYRAVCPVTWSETGVHAATAYVTMELGLKGPATTLSAGCSTGLDSLGWGFQTIRSRRADMVVCGAAEAPLTPFIFGTMCASGILTTFKGPPSGASRPFAKGRDGIVLSEGAGAVVLEDLDSAVGRGADIYAEILGFASNSEAGDMINTDPSGADISRAMCGALAQAMVLPGEIDYIHAHGSGFPAGDLADTNAIKKTFGARAYSIPVSSIRSMTGQTLAAGGVLQIISTALTLRHGIVPPTINCDPPDELCDLDYVKEGSRQVRVRMAMMNSTSVGGTHSVLLLGRSDWSQGDCG